MCSRERRNFCLYFEITCKIFKIARVILNNMDTKLTLVADKDIIEKAKVYAREQKTSLSNLVEKYLSSLVLKNSEEDFESSPLIKSLTGVISSGSADNYKNDYRDFLTEKYK